MTMSNVDTGAEGAELVVSVPSSRITSRSLVGQLRRSIGIGVALVLLFAYLALTQDSFLTYRNIENVLRTNAVLFVASVGLTFVIVSRGIDLSIGSLAALGGVFLAKMLGGGVPAPLAVLLTVAICIALGGVINGSAIAYGGFNFFVVTLATLEIFRGAALVISDGKAQTTIQFSLIQKIGDGEWAGLSIPVLIAIGWGLIAHLLLRYTRLGRTVYAVGGNEEAARLSGVHVKRVQLFAYATSACCAGLAAVMIVGRLTSSQPVSGAVGLELSAAAAVLLGGASFAGGKGTIAGTAIGVLFLGFMENGLTLAGVPAYWKGIATGVVLFAAIGLDRMRRR